MHSPVYLRSCNHSVKPQSYIASSLILFAYPAARSSGLRSVTTSRHDIASGHSALIRGRCTLRRRGAGIAGNGASFECLGLTWGLASGLFARADVADGVRGSAEKRLKFVSAPLMTPLEPDACGTSSSEPWMLFGGGVGENMDGEVEGEREMVEPRPGESARWTLSCAMLTQLLSLRRSFLDRTEGSCEDDDTDSALLASSCSVKETGGALLASTRGTRLDASLLLSCTSSVFRGGVVVTVEGGCAPSLTCMDLLDSDRDGLTTHDIKRCRCAQ